MLIVIILMPNDSLVINEFVKVKLYAIRGFSTPWSDINLHEHEDM